MTELEHLQDELAVLKYRDWLNHQSDNGYASSGRMYTMGLLIQAKEREIAAVQRMGVTAE